VSFEIQAGDIFGFVGQNGAGKTTTIKSILGLIHPDSGEILFDGKRGEDFRKETGYLPELPYFYDHLTVAETLEYLGGLALQDQARAEVRRRCEETLALLRLSDRRKSAVRTLSKGLQQRVGLAQAIINRPRLLFLDEPFSGLDPIGRAEFRAIIEELNRNGTTVLISSHILSDVQALCNRVAILVQGEVRKEFSLEDRAQLFGESYQLTLGLPGGAAIPEKIAGLASERSEKSSRLGRELTLLFPNEEAAKSALALALVDRELVIREFRAEAQSLEEIFLSLAGASV